MDAESSDATNANEGLSRPSFHRMQLPANNNERVNLPDVSMLPLVAGIIPEFHGGRQRKRSPTEWSRPADPTTCKENFSAV